MPEGPECYKYARSLNKTLAGCSITGVHIIGGRYAKHGKPENLDLLEKNIAESPGGVGIRVIEVRCKGKLIYFNLDNQMTILSTLGLMGKWVTTKTKHCGIAIEYISSETAKPKMIYFKDQIHYGTFSVIHTVDLPKKLKTLGIDVLDRNSFTWEAFRTRARRNGKNTLPVFLMKQNVLCGIGNYLKAEIIYASRSSVSSPINDYTDEQLRRVYDACYNIPYECTFGKFKLCVYGRRKDRIGNQVFMVRTPDKRTTYWVPAICPIDIKTDCPATHSLSSSFGEEVEDGRSDDSDAPYEVDDI